MFWSNDRDNDGNLGMHQQASGQQHSLLSQSAHFVNGPFPATLQVSAKYDVRLTNFSSIGSPNVGTFSMSFGYNIFIPSETA